MKENVLGQLDKDEIITMHKKRYLNEMNLVLTEENKLLKAQLEAMQEELADKERAYTEEYLLRKDLQAKLRQSEKRADLYYKQADKLSKENIALENKIFELNMQLVESEYQALKDQLEALKDNDLHLARGTIQNQSDHIKHLEDQLETANKALDLAGGYVAERTNICQFINDESFNKKCKKCKISNVRNTEKNERVYQECFVDYFLFKALEKINKGGQE